MARPRYKSRYPQYQYGTVEGIVLHARRSHFKWGELHTLKDLVKAGFFPDKLEAHREHKKLVVRTKQTKQPLNLDLALREFYLLKRPEYLRGLQNT